MSLREMLNEELKNLEDAGPWTGPKTVRAADGTNRLECELTAVGKLGCAVNHVTLHTDALADASLDQLREISESLASRLSYLLEPVAPIEVDDEGCVVQLRSDPPHREGDERCYYELLVRRDQLNLRRFRKENKTSREQVPAQLTREVLGRLTDDFVTAASL